MSIQTITSRELTRELLIKMSEVLRSVSTDLTIDQMSGLIDRAIGDGAFAYKAGNDLGMLVSRISTKASYLKGSDQERYTQIRAQDDYIDSELLQLADRLAIPVSQAMEHLRNQIPEQVDQLCGAIKSSLEDPQFRIPETTVEVFAWGQLNDLSFNEAAIIAGQQYANVFKREQPTRLDTDAILSKLPTSIVPIDPQYYEPIKTALIEKLKSETGELVYTDKDIAYVVNSLTKLLSFSVFRTDMRTYMAAYGSPITQTIVGIKQLDTYRAIFETLRSIDLPIPEVIFDQMRKNFKTFDQTSMMCYAAALAHRQEMHDRLFLSNTQVNQDVVGKFIQKGGVESDFETLATYMTHIQKSFVDGRGMKLDALMDRVEPARKAVEEFHQTNQILKTEEERRVKIKALRQALREFQQTQERPAWMTEVTYVDVVTTATKTAETRVGTEGLSFQEVITDYLVQTSASRAAKRIYTEAKEALTEVLAKETELDGKTMSQVLFGSMSSYVCDFLKSKFAVAA